MKILYLRTDFWFGLQAGGSVGHVAGVVKGFHQLGHQVQIFSTDTLPGIPPDVAPVKVVKPWLPLRLPKIRLLGPLVYNLQLLSAIRRNLPNFQPDFIYQRHSNFNCVGALLARHLKSPLILEVNGLIVHWAREERSTWLLLLAPLARLIEQFAFQHTTLFVAVSKVVRDQLVAEGVQPEYILVNPNGVDPDIFHPDKCASTLRESLKLNDKIVVGFIGTFGHWHGIEVLAQAIPQAVKANPKLHFLLIGDGPLRPHIEQIVHKQNAARHVTFTGLIPYEQAPQYLAACDIFVSPHSPPKTDRFIGSPTKLFEYMALAKGIVASNLEQIGEVLEHKQTAVLVEPGNVDELVAAILYLAEHPDEAVRMGQRARQVALDKYTWLKNVERVMAVITPNLPDTLHENPISLL